MLLFIGGAETVVILLFIIIFFGSKKIPELAKGIGKAMREYCVNEIVNAFCFARLLSISSCF